MLKLLPFALVLAAGMGLPVQVGVNSTLRGYVGSPILSSLISFIIGTLVMAVLLAIGIYGRGDPAILATVPWWAFTGGIFGAIYVTSTIIAGPQLGSTVTTIAALTGQVIASLLIDQFGWLGFPVDPVTPIRLLGAAMVIAGVLIIQFLR